MKILFALSEAPPPPPPPPPVIGFPSTVSVPATETFPLTARFPASESEKAEMPLVVVTDVNVGEEGSLGRITSGKMRVVMPGP